jgi:transposase
MKTYSMDLRERVFAAAEAGHHHDDIAKLFSVSTAWIRRLRQRFRELGSLAPLPNQGGPAPKLTPAHLERLRELVAQKPDATLVEYREALGEPICTMTISRALKKLGLPLKKSLCGPPSRIVPTCNSSDASTKKPRNASTLDD